MKRAEPLKTAPVPIVRRPSAEDVNPRGLSAIRMLKSQLVGDRVCAPGDIIRVEAKGPRTIVPVDTRLDIRHAELLIKHGCAVEYTVRPGDTVVSTVSDPPEPQPLPTSPPQTAALHPQKTAEKAVTDRQKAGAI